MSLARAAAGALAGLAGLGLLLWILGPGEGPGGARAGAPAPPVEAADLSGRRVRLADLRGKVVLLDFWATWCGVCAEEAPALSALYERKRARGFELLGLSLDADAGAAARFAARHGLAYPVLFAGEEAKSAYRVLGLPYKVLVARDGTVAATFLADAPLEAVEAEVERLLED